MRSVKPTIPKKAGYGAGRRKAPSRPGGGRKKGSANAGSVLAGLKAGAARLSSGLGQGSRKGLRLFQWELRRVSDDRGSADLPPQTGLSQAAGQAEPGQASAKTGYNRREDDGESSLLRRFIARSGPSVPRRVKQRFGPGDPGRRPPPPRWVNPATRLAMVMFLGAVMAGLPAWLIVSGWAGRQLSALQDEIVTLTGESGDLVVAELLVAGRTEADKDEIAAAIDVERGDAILAIDPHLVKDRLEAIRWIRSAVVERRLPDTIFVHIEERQPLAQWQRSGELSLVDKEGFVIQETVPPRFAALPVIVGPDAPENFPALQAILASQPHLQERVRAAVRVGGRRWNLRVDRDIEVLLPEDNPQAAWDRLAELDFETRLLERQISAVDLRITDRLVLKVPEEVREEIANGTDLPEEGEEGSAASPAHIPAEEQITPVRTDRPEPEASLADPRLRQQARGD